MRHLRVGAWGCDEKLGFKRHKEEVRFDEVGFDK